MKTYRIAVIETQGDLLMSCGLLMNKARRPYDFASKAGAECFAARTMRAQKAKGIKLSVIEVI